VVLEMSYGYLDRAAHGAPGYFERADDGAVTFREGRIWFERLWVDQVLAEHTAAVGQESARDA
jgi:hypothetical protein